MQRHRHQPLFLIDLGDTHRRPRLPLWKGAAFLLAVLWAALGGYGLVTLIEELGR